MRFALVVVEEYTGGTMQLRNDDAFRAVDHKRAVIRHQRHFAEVDLLLADIFHGLRRAACFFVVDNQPNLDANGRCVSEAAHLALFDVEYRLAQPVAHVLKCCVPRVADDREDGLERRVQTDLVPLFFSAALVADLQELVVGIQLNRQQIGHVQNGRALAEVLADSLFLCE